MTIEARQLYQDAAESVAPPPAARSHPAGVRVPLGAPPLRVLIITENASDRFGGEAVLPLHYFRRLHSRGVPVWLITNERNRAELAQTLPADAFARIVFTPNTRAVRALVKCGRYLPTRIATFTTGQAIHLLGQVRARRIARRLIRQHGVTIVHQPAPVSPKQVSAITGLNAKVVIGPLNGGMTFPKGFKRREKRSDRLFARFGGSFATLFNHLVPGKLRADRILVANARTAAALPGGIRGQVQELVENGVDLTLWRRPEAIGLPTVSKRRRAVNGQDGAATTERVRITFIGRLVPMKGVDLLLRAAAQVAQTQDIEIHIIGDGPLRSHHEALAAELGMTDRVSFLGWLSQARCAEELAEADVFVLPSLYECGGAVVLEAMAMGVPCIATNWGGPADYLDASCGILVEPTSPDTFVAGLAEAMGTLAGSAEARQRMGEAGRVKVAREYDWERKIDQMLEIFRDALQSNG